MAKKKKDATPAAPVSWRDLPQDLPVDAATSQGRRRQMRGFYRAYAIVFGLALLAMLILAAPKIGRLVREELASRIPDVPVNRVEFKSNGPIGIGWFNSHVGLPAGATLQRFDHVALRERLLAFGQIEDAQVGKKAPGTLVINLQERAPFARIAIQGPDGLPAVRLCSTDGTIYEGHGYDPQFLSTLPYLALRSLQRDGNGGFKAAPEIALAAELVTTGRSQFPELARSWKVIDLTHYYGDRNDPAAWICLGSDSVQRVLLPPSAFERSLARLRADLPSLQRKYGVLAELDLRSLPDSRFAGQYSLTPAAPPAPPAKPAVRTASVRR